MESTDGTPRRRFFQFSLRSLFAVTLLAAVLCGTLGVRAVYVNDQRAVAERLSGVIDRSSVPGRGGPHSTVIGWEEMPSYLGLPPSALVRRVMGDDFYRNVVEVSLQYNRQLTDDDLAQVNRLDHLRRLDLSLTAIGDEGLRHLGTLPRLESLDLGSTDVSNDGLKYLDGAPALVALGLSFTGIDDEGVTHLVDTHARLSRLDLSSTATSDVGVAALARCQQLDTLILCDTDVTSAGLAKLAQLPRLRVVALNNTAIDDEALTALAALPALEELYLRHTASFRRGDAASRRRAHTTAAADLWQRSRRRGNRQRVAQQFAQSARLARARRDRRGHRSAGLTGTGPAVGAEHRRDANWTGTAR